MQMCLQRLGIQNDRNSEIFRHFREEGANGQTTHFLE